MSVGNNNKKIGFDESLLLSLRQCKKCFLIFQGLIYKICMSILWNYSLQSSGSSKTADYSKLAPMQKHGQYLRTGNKAMPSPSPHFLRSQVLEDYYFSNSEVLYKTYYFWRLNFKIIKFCYYSYLIISLDIFNLFHVEAIWSWFSSRWLREFKAQCTEKKRGIEKQKNNSPRQENTERGKISVSSVSLQIALV